MRRPASALFVAVVSGVIIAFLGGGLAFAGWVGEHIWEEMIGTHNTLISVVKDINDINDKTGALQRQIANNNKQEQRDHQECMNCISTLQNQIGNTQNRLNTSGAEVLMGHGN